MVLENKDTCGIIFSGDEFKDVSGCLKPNAHNNAHVCRIESGELMEWEDDYECKCGCWDDYENDQEVCIIYGIVKTI